MERNFVTASKSDKFTTADIHRWFAESDVAWRRTLRPLSPETASIFADLRPEALNKCERFLEEHVFKRDSLLDAAY